MGNQCENKKKLSPYLGCVGALVSKCVMGVKEEGITDIRIYY